MPSLPKKYLPFRHYVCDVYKEEKGASASAHSVQASTCGRGPRLQCLWGPTSSITWAIPAWGHLDTSAYFLINWLFFIFYFILFFFKVYKALLNISNSCATNTPEIKAPEQQSKCPTSVALRSHSLDGLPPVLSSAWPTSLPLQARERWML